MSDARPATVQPISEDQATGRVAEIFADIKATKNIDFVPALWRTIATNPVQLELVWNTLKTLMHPEAVGRKSPLDPATREIIALVVSATNGCEYCVNSHTAALRKLGTSTATLGEIMAIASLFNMTNTLADGYQVEPDVLPPLEPPPSTKARTMNAQPLIAVNDVEASSAWYQRVLDATSGHGGKEYERIMRGGEFILQLHHWDAHEHPHLGNANGKPYGNGVLLWFQTDEFDAALTRIRELGATVLEGPQVNPNAQHREIWLRDLDGYVVVIAGAAGDLGNLATK